MSVLFLSLNMLNIVMPTFVMLCANMPNVVMLIFITLSFIVSLFWGRFVEQKLMLSSCFRRDQIYNCRRYDFGHTLLCYLSLTLMFNKPASEYFYPELCWAECRHAECRGALFCFHFFLSKFKLMTRHIFRKFLPFLVTIFWNKIT